MARAFARGGTGWGVGIEPKALDSGIKKATTHGLEEDIGLKDA